MQLPDLIRFYETLTPETLSRIGEHYAADCYFKDPFNEVRDIDSVRDIFERMFRDLIDPRFRVEESLLDLDRAMLRWTFTFRVRAWQPHAVHVVEGVSLVRFGEDGRVVHHRDYWDPAEALYEKMPLIGTLLRAVKRRMG